MTTSTGRESGQFNYRGETFLPLTMVASWKHKIRYTVVPIGIKSENAMQIASRLFVDVYRLSSPHKWQADREYAPHQEAYTREVKILEICQDVPGVIRLVSAEWSERLNQGRMITERCTEKNLSIWAKEKSMQDKLIILVKIAKTANALHQRGIAYCDYNSSNIGITRSESGELEPKLLCFSDAKCISETSENMTRMARADFDSPQAVLNLIQRDVFSLGRLFYEILQQPFRKQAYDDDVTQCMNQRSRSHGSYKPSCESCAEGAKQEDVDQMLLGAPLATEVKKVLVPMLKLNPVEIESLDWVISSLESLRANPEVPLSHGSAEFLGRDFKADLSQTLPPPMRAPASLLWQSTTSSQQDLRDSKSPPERPVTARPGNGSFCIN